LDLFFGVTPLFPMRPGRPEEQQGSALLQYLDQFYDYGRNEDNLCWLPYPELFIDSWNTDYLTIAGMAPVRSALLFGNGSQRFPKAELLAAGVTEAEFDRLAQGRWTDEPTDLTVGRERFRLAQLPPDREVQVTWRATIGEFVGEPHASIFQGLRQYGRDEDLRILSRRG
jgi:hypothetical protein